MLRMARLSDKDILMRMALDFKAASIYAPLKHDIAKIGKVVDDFLKDDTTTSVCIVACDEQDTPVGVIAGVSAEIMWSFDNIATELIWWVDVSARRGKLGMELKKAFEFWAYQVGCVLVGFAHLENSREGKVLSRYYKKQGYQLVEQTWVKRIR